MAVESKFKTVFAAKIRALEPQVSDETKQKVKEAAASLKQLKIFASDIDPAAEPDILYVVANLACPGKVNFNDDAISTKDALAVYKKFEGKFVDIEHNRAHICGYIVRAGLSEWGTDRPITEEEAATLPYFNIVTVSALWKSVNRPLCNLVSDAANPESPYYKDVSLSFEVGFDDYKVAVSKKDSRDIDDAETVLSCDDEGFDKLDARLRANDGNGLTENGEKMVYRILTEGLRPLGQGIVSVPAAQVKGIEVIEPPKVETEEEEDDEDEETEVESKEKSIKISESSVSENKEKILMKLNTLEDIQNNWDAMLVSEAKGLSFANAREIITKAMIEESTKLGEQAKQAKLDAEAKEAARAEAVANAEKLAKELETVKNELNAFKQKQAEVEAQLKFDTRMSAIKDEYDFSDDEREVIVSEIRNLDDESFNKWAAKAKVMYKEKTKAFKQAKAGEVKAALEKAGLTKTVEKLGETIDFAEIFASVKVESAPVMNTVDTKSNTIKDAMTAAFGNISFVPEKK